MVQQAAAARGDLIGLFVPSAAHQAEGVYAALECTAPEDGRPLFCQGDFVPGQILAGSA